MAFQMMTSTEILQAMVAENGHIEVLRGPTTEYITVCRPDRSALLEGDLPRSILDDLIRASFVWQDGKESGEHVTTFRLTADEKKSGKK